ncbi:MAG: hypothetical protein U5K43_11425 [Halofilum sp. (in: g-proteobacteria)]|nr:hypothetical protein [Halofilum sp. (in: g-proteobacteria)]
MVSPGVSLREPATGGGGRGRGRGASATSSCSRAPPDAPVVAITGSNGKSTVTAMTRRRCSSAAGRPRPMGGNLGTPALDAAGRDPDARDSTCSSSPASSSRRRVGLTSGGGGGAQRQRRPHGPLPLAGGVRRGQGRAIYQRCRRWPVVNARRPRTRRA